MPTRSHFMPNRLRLRWKELRAYIAALRRPYEGQRRVLILAGGRTGSTAFEDLLASTGYFEKGGKALKLKFMTEVRWPLAYLNGCVRMASPKHYTCCINPPYSPEGSARPLQAPELG